jgi:hypothetical protein
LGPRSASTTGGLVDGLVTQRCLSVTTGSVIVRRRTSLMSGKSAEANNFTGGAPESLKADVLLQQRTHSQPAVE